MSDEVRKIHTLYDLETQIPAFFHITTASVHDSKAMKEIPIETGAYYIFDRGYNNFKELYRIHRAESFFVVRAKTNLQYKCIKWRRRLPKGILTDAEIELTIYGSQKGYPAHLRLVRFFLCVVIKGLRNVNDVWRASIVPPFDI